MKSFNVILTLLLLLLTACSSTRVIDSWRSDEFKNYRPKQILIVGITNNLTARMQFEECLAKEFTARGMIAVESYNVFRPTFTALRQNEEEIKEEVERFSGMGYDAILVNTVKGVDEEVAYSGGYGRRDYYWRRFKGYYFVYQDIYFDPEYYDKYKVYHIEASMYDMQEQEEKQLVWVASFDMIDPKNINNSIKDYIKKIVKTLEKEEIISTKKR